MGELNRGSFPLLLRPGVREIFGYEFDTYKNEYSEIFDVQTSDMAYEEDLQVNNMGLAVVKNEGDPVKYAGFQQGYTKRYVHITYGLGFMLTWEVERDIKYGIKLANMGATMLADSLNQTKEVIAANQLNNATSTSNPYVGGDGAALLSASHPLGGGGGTLNNLATADLSELALEDAVIGIGTFVDNAGKRIMLRPTKLIIPIQSEFLAHRILKSELRQGTANNDINALRSMNMIGDISVNHYLTDTNFWMLKTNIRPEYGFKMYQRIAPESDAFEDKDTRGTKVTIMESYSVGFSDPRCAYGSMGM